MLAGATITDEARAAAGALARQPTPRRRSGKPLSAAVELSRQSRTHEQSPC